MEIRTRVREVHGEWARLVCEEPGHCELCAGSRGCGFGLIGASGGRVLRVPRCTDSAQRLETGDLVLVSVADDAIVRAAAVTYLLPVAGLLAGAALAQLSGVGDGTALFAALGGALAGICYGRRIGTRRFRAIPARARETGVADG